MNRNVRALANRSYLLVWIGSLLSNVGNWMENVGQGWVVASQTHSPFLVELLSFANFIPVIFLAMLAGIMADRFNRKYVLLGAQVAMCLFATTLAILAHLGKATPKVVIAITFLEGAAWAINAPSWQAVIPHLVPRKDLESAIALNSIQYNLARLVGPAIAGIVVSAYGFAYAFDLNAVSFVAVILAIVSVNFGNKPPKSEEVGTRAQFKHAAHWVWKHKGARRVVISLALFAFLSAPLQGLMPFFASDILNIGAKGLGNLLACLGAGAITGAFLLGNLPVYYPRHHLIPLSMTVLGVFELLYSQSTSILLSYSVIYVTGIFWLWILVSCNTAMQLLVPDAIRGRTMSILLLANVGVLPFGHIAAGFMAKYISPQLTMIITSGLLILVGLVTLFNRIPEIDGYEAKGHPEVIMASSHRAEALALDRTKEK